MKGLDPRRWLTPWLTVLLVLFVLLGVGAPLVGRGVFLGSDIVLVHDPWSISTPSDFRADNTFVGDTVDGVVPAFALVRERLLDGDVASWLELSNGGAPLATVPSYAIFSPLSLPYLLLPPWLAPAISKALELLVTYVGMLLFLRRLSLSTPAALLGGLLFASSGFMVTWTNWPHTKVAAFLPWLFWAVERFAQLRTWRAAVPISPVVAAMLLGGFPVIVVYALGAAAPYLLLRLAVVRRQALVRLVPPVLVAAGTLALGVALVAWQLLPFVVQLDGLDLSYREQLPSNYIPRVALLTAALPRALGSHTQYNYFGPLNEIEVNAFLGVAGLMLVVVALVRRPAATVPPGVRSFLLAVASVSVTLSYLGGRPLTLAQDLPVLSNNPAYRLRVMLGFALAVLAAIGYDSLIRRRSDGRRHWVGWGLSLVVWGGAALVGALLLRELLLTYGIDKRPHLMAQVRPAAVLGAVAALGLLAARFGQGRARLLHPVGLALVPVIVLVESLGMARPFWPRTPRDQFYPVTPVHQFLAERLGHDRYASSETTMYPGTNVFYGLRCACGHTFVERPWAELIGAVNRKPTPSATFITFTSQRPDLLYSPILDRMAVRYFVRGIGEPPLGEDVALAVAAPPGPLRSGETRTVPLGDGPLRAVGLPVTMDTTTRDRIAGVRVEIVDALGRVVAAGERRVYQGTGSSMLGGTSVLFVPVAGEDLRGPLTARITPYGDYTVLTVGGPMRVVRPRPDGLRLVFTHGAQVYERSTALPRVRWAATASVIEDRERRIDALQASRGPLPGVVLSTPGPSAEGRPAHVTVVRDRGEDVVASVAAQGGGYLVVADALQRGWSATVDGKPARLRPADHAMVAVYVPPGVHEVALRYDAPGRAAGGVVSAFAALVLIGLSTRTRATARAPAAEQTSYPLFPGNLRGGTARRLPGCQLLGHEDGVDEVHGGVARLHVVAHDAPTSQRR